jgi:hypothetical protein
MIGGRAPEIFGSPPLKESLLMDFMVASVLKMETSLTAILTPASPDTDKPSGSSKIISILTPLESCLVTMGEIANLFTLPSNPLSNLSFFVSLKVP